MARGVGDDFVGLRGGFAGGIKRRANYCNGDDESFKHDGADDPADDGDARVAFGFRGEEFGLILWAAKQQHRIFIH